MNRKTLKAIVAVALIATIIAVSSTVFALTPDEMSANIGSTTSNTITKFGQNLMGVLQTVGVIVAVLILIVLGIKYMMGSSEEKASYKKTMMPYFIGALLLFGASTFAGMIIDLAKSLNA